MPFYITILLIILIFSNFLEIKKASYLLKYHTYLDYFFTLAELLLFSNFFYLTLNNRIIKKIIVYIVLFFSAIFLYFLFRDLLFHKKMSISIKSSLYTIEALLLTIPCFYYFVELFNTPPTLSLKNEYSFWVSTGLLFFLIGTLPFSILENQLLKIDLILTKQLYSIFFIFYDILFIMIIKAYLCKPTEKQS